MTIREQIAAWPEMGSGFFEDASMKEQRDAYRRAAQGLWHRIATADAVIDALVRSTGDAEVNAVRDAIEYQQARAVLDALDK